MTRPALIGLDGRSGSGKTVLAAALAARIAPFARVEPPVERRPDSATEVRGKYIEGQEFDEPAGLARPPG